MRRPEGTRAPRRWPVLVGLVLAVLLTAAGGLSGRAASHEDSTSAPAGAARLDSLAAPDGVLLRPARGPFVMPSFIEEVRNHVHNKVIHFPIVLAIAGFALLVASRRRPGLEPGARALIWTGAAFAVIAYFSGRLQAEEFQGKPKEWVVRLHESWGIGAALGMIAWGLVASWGRARAVRIPIGALVVAAILVAGYLGGIAAHGH